MKSWKILTVVFILVVFIASNHILPIDTMTTLASSTPLRKAHPTLLADTHPARMLTPAAPQNLAATAASPTSIILTWLKAPAGEQITYYYVYRNGTKLQTIWNAANTYVVENLTASTTYNFHVTAYDEATGEGPASLTVTATTLAAPRASMNIYADQTLPADITDGTYSITDRNNTGSDGNAYNTIQAALNAMNPGDKIYMRGGTYHEGSILIRPTKNGTAWTEGNHNLLTSYPGEWAIIDGQNNADNDRQGMCLGYPGMSTYEGDLHYWQIERFEIKNCRSSDGNNAIGLYVNDGPFIIRYLYIHDNGKNINNCDNNPSGFRSYRMHDSIVEYNYFKDNGGPGEAGNCANVAIFSDYHWNEPDVADINHAIRKNEIRYNLFEGSHVGFKHKGAQILCNHTGTDLDYKDMGDKIHHNIFLGNALAVYNDQDFAQIYNNITVDGKLTAGDKCGECNPRPNVTIYNNTVINSNIRNTVAYRDMPDNFHPYYWSVNNIVDNFTNEWDEASLTLGQVISGYSGALNMEDARLDRNLVYRPNSESHYALANFSGACSGWLTTEQLNGCYSVSNYLSSAAGLYQGTAGSAQYKTQSNFSLAETTTIANGGLGGPHPYLENVTLPSYVGACADDACSWVDYVLTLRNLGDITITDLRVAEAITTTNTLTATLTWTAPIDAITYTLRYANASLTDENWPDTTSITVPFTATIPGNAEYFTLTIPYSNGTVFFALKSQNDAGAWSPLSNNAFWPHRDIFLPLIQR